MLRFTCLFILVSLTAIAVSQTNIHFTNPAIYDVLKGNYDPADYAASIINDDPVAISQALLIDINPDSLKALLTAMQAFENRNTGSDTISETRGMGAARKWVLSKFDEYDARSENRLLTGFLQFDQDVCGMGRHKNIVAVLPGRNNTNPSSILIEAHLDSRCADNCDGDCLAQGMEDNGSGTALVMELARVMSKYTFDHTIIFMATTGEEQGLVGAEALAIYAEAEGIPIKAVLNNDIVGGVICGETSSPPSCPGLNHIDSTQVRLFSQGGFNSANKALSRYIKLQYAEMLKQHAAAPMAITIMSAEDRTGRGGDHIPFRERGFPAMRFTSANEHGNADVSSPDYHDRNTPPMISSAWIRMVTRSWTVFLLTSIISPETPPSMVMLQRWQHSVLKNRKSKRFTRTGTICMSKSMTRMIICTMSSGSGSLPMILTHSIISQVKRKVSSNCPAVNRIFLFRRHPLMTPEWKVCSARRNW
jgi:Zn-dependent M28 family amino/carboxypeptidase